MILYLFLLYIPAMVANMAPVFASKYNVFPWLNKPIDFGSTWRGKRVLGGNKTIRGFVLGGVAALSVGAILYFISGSKPYDSLNDAFAYSAATGCAALIADSVKSFFKRRIGITPGMLWIPFDQIDFVIGATLAASFFVNISFANSFFAIIFFGFLSYVVSKIGFALHIKKNL